ncbi:MAG: NAD(P)/FAD-dependent oxidoreductase [Alphaproteobacteria bacterium]|nr:MAG: NAD(P)/FAD-dependent oxidoreductase [Alphaproteobacteria bacterium]
MNETNQIVHTDVLVIGAGPSGLFSVFMLGQVGLTNVTLVDSLSEIGGQCTALYPDKYIYDVAGFKEIYAKDLIDRLYDQMNQYNPNIILDTKVSQIKKHEERFTVTLSNGQNVETRAIIIASGAGSFSPKKPDLEDIDKYDGIFYKLENPSQFTGSVAVFGGGDSAVDWCLTLSEHAREVFLIHRRDKFRAMDGSLEKLKDIAGEGRCQILTPYVLHNINSDESYTVSSIDIKHTKTNEIKNISIDTLIPCYGLQSDNELLYDIGIDMYGSKIKIIQESCETSIEGIYAVGDSVFYPNRHHLIVCGFSEAAIASLHIRKNIFSESKYIKEPYVV